VALRMNLILHLDELIASGVVEFSRSFQIDGALEGGLRISHFLVHRIVVDIAPIKSEILQTLFYAADLLDRIEIAQFERTFHAVVRHSQMAGTGGRIYGYLKQPGLVSASFIYLAVDIQNVPPVGQRNVEAFEDEPELRGRAFLDELVKLIGTAGLLFNYLVRDLEQVAGEKDIGVLTELLKLGIRIPQRRPEKTVLRRDARDTVPLLHDVIQLSPSNSEVQAITDKFYLSMKHDRIVGMCFPFEFKAQHAKMEFAKRPTLRYGPLHRKQQTMPGRTSLLELSRAQILSFRRRVGSLDERLRAGPRSLRQAAWAGLQDSMPRAALLSIHARVDGTSSATWEHPSLVQLWGPRFSAYVIAAQDLPVFSLGRLPDDAVRRARAQETATRLDAFLDGRRMPFAKAGHAMGVQPNSLRYAAATGTVVLRWDGARQPTVWIAPPPDMEPRHARVELARRYLHIFGPATATSFARWAGIRPVEARTAFEALTKTLTPVRTPVGDAWILADDVAGFRGRSGPAALARLLPSGDTYYLLWGADRELLVPHAKRQTALWTTRVWPGALLVREEIAGVWRRSAAEVSIETWQRLSSAEREAVEAEALSLPLPGLNGPITFRWS
jgi:hypothetical protein